VPAPHVAHAVSTADDLPFVVWREIGGRRTPKIRRPSPVPPIAWGGACSTPLVRCRRTFAARPGDPRGRDVSRRTRPTGGPTTRDRSELGLGDGGLSRSRYPRPYRVDRAAPGVARTVAGSSKIISILSVATGCTV